ncbi:MAG: chemotaxis protein CheW [Eubacteriales bacterium]
MSQDYNGDSLLEMFIYETWQNTEQLEQIILNSEKVKLFSEGAINEIFRIMHTIKGSSAMMSYKNISGLAHKIEELFSYIRNNPARTYNFALFSELLLESMDYINNQLETIKSGGTDSEPSETITEKLDILLPEISGDKSEAQSEKNKDIIIPSAGNKLLRRYKAVIKFVDDCGMENLRAFSVVQNVSQFTDMFYFQPDDILDNDDTSHYIKDNGFTVFLKTYKEYDQLKDELMLTTFLQELYLEELDAAEKNDDVIINQSHDVITDEETNTVIEKKLVEAETPSSTLNAPEMIEKLHENHTSAQSYISVNITKLDLLMNLIGELVIAEAMVTQNPDLEGLEMKNFQKASAQLRKIVLELQDSVMSIRMVPLSASFQKMHRIVRDINKKLGKDIGLKLIGEETEVDRNIIEHLSDPLMHLVRNSADHGIEMPEERELAGKPRMGTITLEAENAGSFVVIKVTDDGKGLNKSKIYEKAKSKGLVDKAENELSDKELYNLIFLPGFSTKDAVSEFSGRGVGMDVVVRNIEDIGGNVTVNSIPGQGTEMTIKIPLTLAIIDGMNLKVGESLFTIPISAIRESFKIKQADVITDPDGNELIMVRGSCYPIFRLHNKCGINTDIKQLDQGIIIMVEQDEKARCVFVDELIGQQQVVVKALPSYIKKSVKDTGISGCTLLGNGSISLILDAGWLVKTDI